MPTRRERAQVEQERARKIARQRNLLIGGGILAAVIVVGVIVLAGGALNPAAPAVSPSAAPAIASASCSNVQSFPSQGQDHIQPNQSHPAYSSTPPTSGWHWANAQDWGIYTTPQVQEQLVHNLEHGGIIVQYNGLSPAEIQMLTDIVRRDSYHVILAPYPELPADVQVALTAWTHLQTCTGVDENAVKTFTSAFRNKGPELVP